MSVPDANEPSGADAPPGRAGRHRWRLAAAAAVAVVCAAGLAVVLGVGRIAAPPSGLPGGHAESLAREPAVADAGPTAPPPWAVPAAPAAAPRKPAAPAVATTEPTPRHARKPSAPSAYPPAIEDAIHAALDSGRSQPWNALGVKGWVTVSAAGGPDHACRAYRVVRDTGATAPETLCRASDGGWRPGL